MTALFKKRVSAFDVGQGLSQILRDNGSEIFNLLGVKGIKVEGGAICENSVHESCEVSCGILWAICIGIQKSGFRSPLPELIIDGTLATIQIPALYAAVLEKLPIRIKEYNEIMLKYLPDHSRAIFCVSDRFCENIYGKKDHPVDVAKLMKISLRLSVATTVTFKTLEEAEKEFKIVSEKGAG